MVTVSEGERFMPARSTTLSKDLRTIQVSLRQLLRAFERLGPALRAAQTSASAKPRHKLRLTPARRAALQLHGYRSASRGATRSAVVPLGALRP